MTEKAIKELKATNGTILLYNDRVVIRRTGLFAFASQGIKGDTTFFYRNLSGIDYKKPGLTNGYMRFVTAGTATYNSGTGLFATPQSSAQDPNTVILRAFNRKVPALSEEIYQFILQKISEAKTNTVISESFSGADEIAKYKSLLDQGIISQEEFDNKKKQILNL